MKKKWGGAVEGGRTQALNARARHVRNIGLPHKVTAVRRRRGRGRKRVGGNKLESGGRAEIGL